MTGAPIAIVVNFFFWSFLVEVFVEAVVALGTLIGLIRIRAYGDRSPEVTLTMVALFVVWVVILAAHILVIQVAHILS